MGIAAGLRQHRQAKGRAYGAAWREPKVGGFASLHQSWVPPHSSLQLLLGACSSTELPHHIMTLTARGIGIPHHAKLPQEMQPSPRSFRYPVFILPQLTEETKLPEPQVKIIAYTKPRVGESLLSCIFITFQRNINFLLKLRKGKTNRNKIQEQINNQLLDFALQVLKGGFLP